MDGTIVSVAQGDALAGRFSNLGDSLKPADLESGWFYHLIIDLMKAALAAYKRLVKCYNMRDYHLLAGACRNLLELAIFMRYVLISESHARKFAEDRLIDGCELLAALKTLELHYDSSADTTALDAAISTFEAQMATENVTRRKHLELHELAAEVGMKAEYTNVNRVCSKLVHCCAWSVMAVNDEVNSFPEAREILFGNGIMFLSKAHIAIKEHNAAHGVRPIMPRLF